MSSAIELETLCWVQESEIDFVELTAKRQVLAAISESQPEAS